MIKILAVSAGVIVLLVVALVVTLWAVTYHPPDTQPEPVVCPLDAPTLEAARPLKVMTWNVQFMAGKGYVFFFDVLEGNGPDERPSPAAITHTLDEVARVIRAEQPDVVLLQEVDDGAGRTDRRDELQELLDRLPAMYPCHASAFYWKAAFVPHPHIHGPVAMKLAVISRYRIASATRLALPGSESKNFLAAQFNLKRAILEVRLPVAHGPDLVILDTHLAAFAQGSDTMERQVHRVAERLQQLDEAGNPWILGGDFNLLPPGDAYRELPPPQQAYYRPDTELSVLYDRWPAVPDRSAVTGPGRSDWFTHFPNDPQVTRPDRTIDYLFHSPKLAVEQARVRREDTLQISDHEPLIATFGLTR